jgi:hypothetical protein
VAILYEPLRDNMTLEARFQALDAARDRVMERARDHAAYTLPRVLPEDNETLPPGQEDLDMSELFWHRPGRNALQLANKLTNAIFPANGVPFFEFQVGSEIKALRDSGQITPEAYEELERMKVQVENDIHNDLQSSNFRQQLQMSILKILILPDDLIYLDDNGKFRTYRIDHFVIRRDITGEIAEIITRDWTQEDLLPDYLKNIKKPAIYGGYDRYEPLFTQLRKDPDTGIWKVKREFRKTSYKEGEGEYKKDAFPYFHMHWSMSTGEDYGTSLVEQIFGLIRSGEATAKALVEGLVAGSQGYMSISPTGITTIEDVYDKPNWSWISARQEDVFALQPNTSSSVVTAAEALRQMSEDLDAAFMTNASTRLTGERVTAFQVDRLVSEQDEALGGMLTHTAQQVQRPVVLRMLAVRQKNGLLPGKFKEMLDKGYITLNIKTGLDALGRQLDTLRLQAVGQTLGSLAQVFPEIAEKVNGLNFAEDMIKNSGLDVGRYAHTLEDINQRRAAQQQQAVQQVAAEQTISSAGKIAEQQLGQQ